MRNVSDKIVDKTKNTFSLQ